FFYTFGRAWVRILRARRWELAHVSREQKYSRKARNSRKTANEPCKMPLTFGVEVAQRILPFGAKRQTTIRREAASRTGHSDHAGSPAAFLNKIRTFS
ncbi:MAG: hypothetical protein IJA78_04235, partial [Clostridia bacterium]|nr:hypothetical protein [Clostridia bacterium]